MGRDSRHRTVARIRLYTGPLAVHAEPTGSRPRSKASLSRSLARRGVHRLLRVAVRARRGERREPWAVADQRDRASVGERVTAYLELALQREGRLQDKRWWKGFFGMDDGEALLAVRRHKNGEPEGSPEQGTRGKHTA